MIGTQNVWLCTSTVEKWSTVYKLVLHLCTFASMEDFKRIPAPVHSPCGGEDGEGILVFVDGVKVLPPEYGWAGGGTDTNKQIWRRKTTLLHLETTTFQQIGLLNTG